MHAISVTPAIVLRAWPFGESDKIVSFLTADFGKVTGIAKGAKRSLRRFVNTLESFSLVQLRFQDRPHSTLAFIHACDLIRPHKNLTTSLERIAHAAYMVEIIDALAGEREENRALFEHLRGGLLRLEEHGASSSFLAFFELRVLRFAGYQPGLEACRRCGTPRSSAARAGWRFSARDGGLLCPACSTLRKDAMPLTSDAIDSLLEIQRAADFLVRHEALPAGALKEGRAALIHFIRFQTNRELKSASFLDASALD